MQKILDASDGFCSCESAASDNEREERFAVLCGAIGICLLQTCNKRIP